MSQARMVGYVGTDRDDSDGVSAALTVEAGGTAIEAAGHTDRGSVRSENQDRWAVAELAGNGGVLLVVADGMGGHAGGAEAAASAVTALVDVVAGADDAHAALPSGFDAATRAVAAQRDHIGGAVSGTTLVAAVVSPDRITVGNVGDSRAYLVRESRPAVVTMDHTWVAEEVRAGRLDAADAAHDPRRNLLLRAITGEAVDVDVFTLEPAAGDVVMLCSDGVWGSLDDAAIAAVCSGERASDVARMLCDAALGAASADNVTAVLCWIGQRRMTRPSDAGVTQSLPTPPLAR